MDEGAKAVQFISHLTVPKGKYGRQPLPLMPFQRDWITRLLGTLNPDGLRQYRETLALIPKKNGKTTIAAALAVYMLFCSEELGGEIYIAANTREQASICFNAAKAMIQADPYLRSQCKIIDSRKTITYPKTDSVFQALSADAGDKNGKNPTVIIYDEICEAPNADLYNALQTGTAGRQQPLTVSISTAGDKHSIGHQIYEHACKVRDGTIVDPTFLPVIYEAPDNADYTDAEVWRRANPGWGITVEESYMRKAIDDCGNMPTRLNALLRYHLNIWADKDTAWIPSQVWSGCDERYDPQSLVGRDCWAGLDLSATIDVTALVLVFPLDDGRWAVLPRFYVPGDTAARRERLDRVPYQTWIREKYITGTAGKVVDYQATRNDLNELKSVYHIRGVAYDDWNATQLVAQLKDDGLDMHQFRQGWKSFVEPCKEFEKLVIGRKLLHNANPVLAWMASNVVAETDAAGNLRPNKSRSRDKIDGVVALVMALGLALREGATDGKSVYESRGVLRF